ncbi:MAG: hypothetical protein ABIP51_23980 [Bacteroidia bacterium]
MMFKKASFFILIILSSCNYTTEPVSKSPKEVLEVKEKPKNCVLIADTFSFKGIKISDDITYIKKKYTLKKLPNFKFQRPESKYSLVWDTIIIPDFPGVIKYEIKSLRNLTVFGNEISALTISTYKNKIYNIEISVLENEKDFNFTNIMGNLAEKYNAKACINYMDEVTKVATLGDLNLSNNKLSIRAYITESNIKYYKSTLLGSEVFKNKEKQISYKLQFRIVVTDLISLKYIDNEHEKLDLEKEKKEKEDF